MYRLQVWHNNAWKWGVKTYDSFEEALSRIKLLSSLGIKARVKLSSELFN